MRGWWDTLGRHHRHRRADRSAEGRKIAAPAAGAWEHQGRRDRAVSAQLVHPDWLEPVEECWGRARTSLGRVSARNAQPSFWVSQANSWLLYLWISKFVWKDRYQKTKKSPV